MPGVYGLPKTGSSPTTKKTLNIKLKARNKGQLNMGLKPKPQTMRCLTIPRVQKFARPPTCRNSPMNETRVTQTPHRNPIYEAHIGGDKMDTCFTG
ncbi:hypothetical protein Bca101_095291 [Brassica carinata]